MQAKRTEIRRSDTERILTEFLEFVLVSSTLVTGTFTLLHRHIRYADGPCRESTFHHAFHGHSAPAEAS